MDPEERKEILAEYSVLRDEILALSRIRIQIIVFTLGILGAILTFSVGEKFLNPLVLWAYPILCMFFAKGWTHNHCRIGQIGRYIKYEIEPKIKNMGWEFHLEKIALGDFRAQEALACYVFVWTPIVVLILAFIGTVVDTV